MCGRDIRRGWNTTIRSRLARPAAAMRSCLGFVPAQHHAPWTRLVIGSSMQILWYVSVIAHHDSFAAAGHDLAVVDSHYTVEGPKLPTEFLRNEPDPARCRRRPPPASSDRRIRRGLPVKEPTNRRARSAAPYPPPPYLIRFFRLDTPSRLLLMCEHKEQDRVCGQARAGWEVRLMEEAGTLMKGKADILAVDDDAQVVGLNELPGRVRTALRLRDITERKRLERSILEISEREQRLVGQDIHDGLCQRLFCAAMGCNLLRESLAAQSRPETAEAARVLAQIQAAIREARSLAHGLSLANLDTKGLPAALVDLASTTSIDCRVPCVAECTGSVAVTNPATANHLFRIAREAVHNAVKHARPSRILIRLEATADGGALSITDDGCGIPEGPSADSGMGFDMMKRRANMEIGRAHV